MDSHENQLTLTITHNIPMFATFASIIRAIKIKNVVPADAKWILLEKAWQVPPGHRDSKV